MAQFDVYLNENQSTNKEIPYLLDIQNEILTRLNTRVVIPLVKNQKEIQHLTPIFTIDGENVVMLTSQLAGVPLSILGKKVTNLESERANILSAIDFLITGF